MKKLETSIKRRIIFACLAIWLIVSAGLLYVSAEQIRGSASRELLLDMNEARWHAERLAQDAFKENAYMRNSWIYRTLLAEDSISPMFYYGMQGNYITAIASYSGDALEKTLYRRENIIYISNFE